MGKASKKVKRQAQKKADERRLQACRPQEAELEAAFVAEEYARVLEILAQLIQAKDIKPELLYKGAYSYFMLGDYERAAQWVNNTLNFAPRNIEARILLARICFMEERYDDGLALYDFLVKNFLKDMGLEQIEQIMDSTEYYVSRAGDNLQEKFPALADFLQAGMPAPAESAAVSATENASASVADTKPAGGSALASLQRLKAKLQAVQQENADERQDSEKSEPVVEPEIVLPVSSSVSEEVDKEITDIESRTCSLREKVQIFNRFAAAHYAAGDYKDTEKLLKAALFKDDGDVHTLRNMAMTQAALGNKEKAQAFAAKLPEVDFVLLYLLREQGK